MAVGLEFIGQKPKTDRAVEDARIDHLCQASSAGKAAFDEVMSTSAKPMVDSLRSDQGIRWGNQMGSCVNSRQGNQMGSCVNSRQNRTEISCTPPRKWSRRTYWVTLPRTLMHSRWASPAFDAEVMAAIPRTLRSGHPPDSSLRGFVENSHMTLSGRLDRK